MTLIQAELSARGIAAEQRFFEAWEDKEHFPPWLRSVRPASRREDLTERTDAVMTTTWGTVRVQLKVKVRREWLKRKHSRRGIVILQVRPGEPLDHIRRLTIDKIEQMGLHREDGYATDRVPRQFQPQPLDDDAPDECDDCEP